MQAMRLLALMSASSALSAMSDVELKTLAEQRVLGDRSGACVAVAVVEKTVSRAFVCADPAQAKRIGANTAFEIGSVSKTMLSALLADFIIQGKATLDDPLSAYLPKGVTVPNFNGQPILLKHLVTHTSGLPVVPDFGAGVAMDNPYAKVEPASLYKTLAAAKLARAPGSQFEYSNYAMMLLSDIVARLGNQNLEMQLREKLFNPTGMTTAYIAKKPKSITAAQGHTPNRKATSAWDFQTNLAGVGGVRATLDDMIAYSQAHLGQRDSSISTALRLSQQPIAVPSQVPMAMNWMLAPLDAKKVLVHEGGTGGFSAMVAIDVVGQRAVVVLSDTALTTVGGLSSLANHLLDARLPLGKPRRPATPDAVLIESLAGEYDLQGLPMRLRAANGRLYAQAAGQAEYELGYDSEGDFYPLEYDAIIRPNLHDAKQAPLTFFQSGAALPMTRKDSAPNPVAAATPAVVLTATQLAEYPGVYAILPPMFLKVFIADGALMAQATGQGAFALEAAGNDVFTAKAYGIEIKFGRDANGKVAMLGLLQGGRELKGERLQETPAGG
jgi:serine-type D-Ala-D-Ala carboxypeptidase/endopeptidase